MGAEKKGEPRVDRTGLDWEVGRTSISTCRRVAGVRGVPRCSRPDPGLAPSPTLALAAPSWGPWSSPGGRPACPYHAP